MSFSNTNPNCGYFIKHCFLSQAPSIEHVVGAWKKFHTTLASGYLHHHIFFYFALHLSRDILIRHLKKLDYFIRVFDLLALLYLLSLSSIQSTHHFIFIIYQVYYNSIIWDVQPDENVHPLPHPKQVTVKEEDFYYCWYHKL